MFFPFLNRVLLFRFLCTLMRIAGRVASYIDFLFTAFFLLSFILRQERHCSSIISDMIVIVDPYSVLKGEE